MNNHSNNQRQVILRNTLKSFTVLCLGSLAFILLMTLFPLIGSFTLDNFPIQQVVKDNFKLLIPLIVVSLIISPFLGLVSYKCKKRRFLYLFIIGIIACWLAIVTVMLVSSNFTISKNDMSSFALISAWALMAYSFLAQPILIPAILIIEKWTRYKAQ